MKFKHLIQDYFTFGRNERKGVIILLILIFILAVANKTIFYFEKPAKIDVELLDSITLDALKTAVCGHLQSWELPRHWNIDPAC